MTAGAGDRGDCCNRHWENSRQFPQSPLPASPPRVAEVGLGEDALLLHLWGRHSDNGVRARPGFSANVMSHHGDPLEVLQGGVSAPEQLRKSQPIIKSDGGT